MLHCMLMYISAFTVLLLAACAAPATEPATVGPSSEPVQSVLGEAVEAAALPRFEPAGLAEGEKLQVVATTSIVADVVKQVGGDRVDLYTMLPVGADPHSYQATPQDLRALTDAHVIFINGLGLEEALALALEDFVAKTVSVNTGVETLELGEGAQEGAAHAGVDPHTWLSVRNVELWTRNIARVLSDLDPANADAYETAAAAYTEALAALEAGLAAQIAQLPEEQRKLVTDHDELGYFARDYGFELIGAVIPSFSTLSEPSAQQVAELQRQIEEAGVGAIFVGTTVNPNLAAQLARDLGVQLVSIYTGSLGEEGGPAASYLDLMRYNVNAIVEALKEP